MPTPGTYVYCVIASARRPVMRRRLARLPGMGPVRVVAADSGMWLAVADAPLDRYSERQINRQLSDLDWVSRAAVVHQAVVEAFARRETTLPMKLFTIFTSDARAVEQVRRDRRRVNTLVRRVAGHLEWGVRVTLGDRTGPPARAERNRAAPSRPGLSGARYLSMKKAQQDAETELAHRASRTLADLVERLAGRAKLFKSRPASEMPVRGGPLLLDAAFLVPRSRARSFQALVAKHAKRLAPLGYQVTLSGPWPPYTFVKD